MDSQDFVSQVAIFCRTAAVIGMIGLSACQASTTQAQMQEAQPIQHFHPLSWESSDALVRRKWSQYVFDLVEQEYAALDRVQDAAEFCPRFEKLSHQQRVNFWGMLISEVARLESAWKPTDRMRESDMGTDPVTHEHVYSEGLMQMSYQDSLWNDGCEFDWSKDRHLSPSDPKKTILNPLTNLKCGVHVLAKQIKQHSRIAISFGVYWSTLHKGTAHQKQIAAGVRNHFAPCLEAIQ